MTSPALICVATCAGAFGVRGEVRIKSFTDVPKDCFAYGPLRDEAGRVFLTITAHRSVKNAFAAMAKEVQTREQAQALSGKKLYVYRKDMPEPDEDEFYFEDLIGCEVKTTNGKRMGKILAVHNYGAGDLLEISQEAKRSEATTGKHKEAKRSEATTGKHKEAKRSEATTGKHKEAKRSEATTGKHKEAKRSEAMTGKHKEAKRSEATTGKHKSIKTQSHFFHPFSKKAVPKVDIKAKRVVIMIEDGDV